MNRLDIISSTNNITLRVNTWWLKEYLCFSINRASDARKMMYVCCVCVYVYTRVQNGLNSIYIINIYTYKRIAYIYHRHINPISSCYIVIPFKKKTLIIIHRYETIMLLNISMDILLLLFSILWCDLLHKDPHTFSLALRSSRLLDSNI